MPTLVGEIHGLEMNSPRRMISFLLLGSLCTLAILWHEGSQDKKLKSQATVKHRLWDDTTTLDDLPSLNEVHLTGRKDSKLPVLQEMPEEHYGTPDKPVPSQTPASKRAKIDAGFEIRMPE
ncbi:hypothetical protein FRC10_005039 [Ceratobasidium sp. 414]|nr:hypothetical protein FRC10_005039 [Ceratobasidium sp. 414]